VLTIDKKAGTVLTSPDIISRGFIYMRDNEELMNDLRNELRRAVQQRFKRVELDRFKQEIKEHVTHFLYEKTQRGPIVIPVINVVGSKGSAPTTVKTTVNGNDSSAAANKPDHDEAVSQARRFAQLRRQLLGQDNNRVD
jgi:ribonuclease J